MNARSRPRTSGLVAVLAASSAIAVMAPTAAAAQAPAAGVAPTPAKITSDTFGALRARPLGPATPSGRVTAIDGVAGDSTTLYVGSASGGLWKTTDGGVTFKPIFDQHTMSIGAVRVDPREPRNVWVGTGESCTRNSVSVGNGVYRSLDGGDTWKHLGLPDSERIAAIQVHPRNSDIAWVCATGRLWADGEERGVFKTTDGGANWKRVLYVDASTGCSDLAVDPQDGDILYAGMWTFRRRPDFFHSGGKGSGLFKSVDGGETWTRSESGLPAGDKGRVAVAVAPSRPSVLYAVVESKKTALYRSDDMGARWREVNSSFNVQVRPFYFAHVVVDPLDHDTVYKPGLFLTVSADGGKSFTNPLLGFNLGSVHSDHHALWIHPRRPTELALGTDGGVYFSWDRGRHWLWAKNLPIAQFYRVSHDMEVPYNVYGGLQDNGSWTGPSRSIGGIEGRDWRNIGLGDGFWAFVDPREPEYVYSEMQGGGLFRVHLPTGEARAIQPFAKDGEEDLRFNWNTPIEMSPHEAGTIYYGAQYLFRSRDRGATWERISPDLTTDDPARQQQAKSGGLSLDNSTAENNTTIYSISESPKNGSVIWVGTDDGNLQVTRDGGASWTNVVANVPGVPRRAWVSKVRAGFHDEATAWVTFDNHRAGDMKPYVYRTRDFGKTWESLVTPEIEGYAWSVHEDLVNPDLVFLGTEFGLYVSIDGGRQWARFTGGLPRVAVHDMTIHPRDHDLILATHGRGVFVLDDITPLRALTRETVEKDVAFLPSRPAEMALQSQLQNFPGNDEYVAFNPAEAATITYWLKKRHLFGDLKVEVYDGEGKLITTLPGSKRVGINRVDWPMRLAPPKVPPASSLVPTFTGPSVLEGTYRVRLVKAKDVYETEVRVVPDRRSRQSAEDRLFQQTTALAVYADLERLTWIAESNAQAAKDLRARAESLAQGDGLRGRLERLAASLDAFGASFVSTAGGYVEGDEKLREHLGAVYGAINQYEGRPTNSQLSRLEILRRQLAEVEAKFGGLAQQVDGLSREAVRRKLAPIAVEDFATWKKRSEAGATAGGNAATLGERGQARFRRWMSDALAGLAR